mmetsp:Transcript_35528/g.52904  ORF Transcript_35528/g.52904 Transcript_35528/m.52904 type:complete len:213 (-) Transcript_35528:43-681(-)
MDSSNSSTGQHSHCKLRNHGHVECHNVTLFDSLSFQCVRDLRNLGQNIGIGQLANIIGFITFPENSNVVSALTFHMAINSIVAHIELATGEPLDITTLQGSAHNIVGVERFVPGEALTSFLGPVLGRILDRFSMCLFVLVESRVRLCCIFSFNDMRFAIRRIEKGRWTTETNALRGEGRARRRKGIGSIWAKPKRNKRCEYVDGVSKLHCDG